MQHLTVANIAIALECLIGTSTLVIASAIYVNAVSSLASVFG